MEAASWWWVGLGVLGGARLLAGGMCLYTACCGDAVVMGLRLGYWWAVLGPRGTWGYCWPTDGWSLVLGSLAMGPGGSEAGVSPLWAVLGLRVSHSWCQPTFEQSWVPEFVAAGL